MFARERLSFQPPRLSTYETDSLSPIIPTLARPSRKSNHSRTYGIPGGGGIYRFFCQTNLSRSFCGSPSLCLLLFQTLAHSFNFRITPIRCIFRSMRTLAQKTGGTPARSYQSLQARSPMLGPFSTNHQAPVTPPPPYQLSRAPHQHSPATCPILQPR